MTKLHYFKNKNTFTERRKLEEGRRYFAEMEISTIKLVRNLKT